MFGAIAWPEEMAPSRSPIHFTNELEVQASPETIWSLLMDPKAWPSFYPGVEHVRKLARASSDGLPYDRQSDCRDHDEGWLNRQSAFGSQKVPTKAVQQK